MSPREIIAMADEHRRHEDAAESAMRMIRLGSNPRTIKRERRRFFIRCRETEQVFNAYETRVLYEALDMVREHHRTQAEEWESKVALVEDTAGGEQP